MTYDSAASRRQALEASRFRWLPHARARLAEARGQEATALHRLQDVKRRVAEQEHAARPFVCERELDARADAFRDRLAERLAERRHVHERDLGLER